MIRTCAGLSLVSLALCVPLSWLMIRLGHRLSVVDEPGREGHKQHERPIPNIGGVAILIATLGPMLVVLAVASALDAGRILPESIGLHLEGLREQTPRALVLAAALLVLHVLGLVDDRRSLGPRIKLLTQFTVAAILAGPLDIRIFELLETYGAPGIAASIAISCLWMVAITNAVNMLDNMDGLAAGVSAVIAATYLAATLIGQQWFVASLCALLLGALVGFLAFNYPRARLDMGDGGSLVVGMLLAVISIRTTYFNPDTRIATDTHWYVVLMPLVVMAVPLYDLISVCVVRLRAGRSPFVGDQNHFSHRLVRRGMSRPAAVALIWLITLATSLGGVMFTTLAPWQAVLVAVQTAAMIAVLALLDFGPGEPGH